MYWYSQYGTYVRVSTVVILQLLHIDCCGLHIADNCINILGSVWDWDQTCAIAYINQAHTNWSYTCARYALDNCGIHSLQYQVKRNIDIQATHINIGIE